MKIKYIELFSGIGAFSQATKHIKNIDFECVYAADNDKRCAKVFEQNYHIDSLRDITKIDISEVPSHDFCFFSPPCQAFSKSGYQRGFSDSRGTLIYEVFKILEKNHPKYILMENVRNLISHDNGYTFKTIRRALIELGYRIPKNPIILSPYQFGVPQTRERTFLPGIYDPNNSQKPLDFEFKNLKKKDQCNAETIIDHSFDDDKTLKITKNEEHILKLWNEFYHLIDKDIIGFPIWSDVFNPYFSKEISLKYDDYPDWKKSFVDKNIELYNNNKTKIDKWLKKYNYLKNLKPTYRKFEWQAGNKINSIWDGIIQFRPSGVRVKAATTFPALVAIVQIPIIGKLKRRLSVKECANLQSFANNFMPDPDSHYAYKQFGNSINVIVLENILKKLIEYKDKSGK